MPTFTEQFTNDTDGFDTFIYNSSPDTASGTDVVIFAGEDNSTSRVNRGLVKFAIPSVAGAVVTSCTLSLWTSGDYSSNARDFNVYRVKRAWTEGATWNKYDGTNSWSTAGGFHSDDCEQTSIGVRNFSASESINAEKQWSLDTTAIAEIMRGAWTNNGFMIKADTETNDGYGFHSSSGATAGYHPKLVIEYLVVDGNPVSMSPYWMFLKKYQRRLRKLLKQGAVPLGNRELLPI